MIFVVASSSCEITSQSINAHDDLENRCRWDDSTAIKLFPLIIGKNSGVFNATFVWIKQHLPWEKQFCSSITVGEGKRKPVFVVWHYWLRTAQRATSSVLGIPGLVASKARGVTRLHLLYHSSSHALLSYNATSQQELWLHAKYANRFFFCS